MGCSCIFKKFYKKPIINNNQAKIEEIRKVKKYSANTYWQI